MPELSLPPPKPRAEPLHTRSSSGAPPDAQLQCRAACHAIAAIDPSYCVTKRQACGACEGCQQSSLSLDTVVSGLALFVIAASVLGVLGTVFRDRLPGRHTYMQASVNDNTSLSSRSQGLLGSVRDWFRRRVSQVWAPDGEEETGESDGEEEAGAAEAAADPEADSDASGADTTAPRRAPEDLDSLLILNKAKAKADAEKAAARAGIGLD